jgi:AcrR family transcriptional regulator
MSVKQRAEPLAPEARRQSIIDAVIPLLLETGGNVTTAQIAEAAGIAEGTIFRVFPDKSSLMFEALKSSFDPAPELDQLARIERDLPFEVKLRKAAAIILNRSERVHALLSVLRSMPPPEHERLHEAHKNAIGANSLLFWAITRVFEDHADRLAVDPARAAAAFRGLMFAVGFPLSDPDELITADEAIEVLLGGVLKENV